MVEVAKIDLKRRAQIGQEKRARTRAQILSAATGLFAQRAIESVTVDDVVAAAGVAKGTFYVHFDDLNALATAVADNLIASFDELLQPRRLEIADPLTRIAFGCNSFILNAMHDSAWASLVARMTWSDPSVGRTARSRLQEDLARVLADAPTTSLGLPAGLEIVLGLMVQALAAYGAGRLSGADRLPVIASILRALGAENRRVRAVLARLPQELPDTAVARAANDRKKRGRGSNVKVA